MPVVDANAANAVVCRGLKLHCMICHVWKSSTHSI